MTQEKSWQKKSYDERFALVLERELKISALMASLLSMRKIKTVDEARLFLQPNLKELIDPLAFAGMPDAISRLAHAIMNSESVGIFGDYDVDGVCSTAILAQFLASVGASVHTTLPNRLLEGYGLSIAGVDRLKKAGTTLLITVDCGALAHEQIDYAKTLGFDVIVVDHHTMGEDIPRALAVINPKRHDCTSKADYLCAAGVTFFLILGIRRLLRQKLYFANRPEPDVRELLDLVALATVCDVVPLIHHNRSLVRAGLKTIKEERRVGLSALIKRCGVDVHKISSTNLGFHLGPRINAAGRLEDATLALKLLAEKDLQAAEDLALVLDRTNEERKEIELQTVEEAKARVQAFLELPHAIVLHDERWHPGVVGIVASRIAEHFHRPAIIIGEKGKGSGRSIKGIDLFSMVQKSCSSLAAFGGHSHAIGLSLGPHGVKIFAEQLNASVAEHVAKEIFNKQLFYDVELTLADINLSLAEELTHLEPFGAQSPYAVVRINSCYLRNLRKLSGGHVKGELENSEGSASFIAFRTEIPDEFAQCAIDVLAVVEKNEWQGRISAQLRLVDFRKSSLD